MALRTGTACFVAQWIAVTLWGTPITGSAVWLPGGLVLAAALLTEPRRWPAVVTAAAVSTTLVFLALRLIELPGAILLSLLASFLTIALAIVLGKQQRTAAALRSNRLHLLALTRELIAVREEEASRIGRELHDDVGQRLALVSIGLSRLRQRCVEATPGSVPDIVQLQTQTNAVVRSVREISHRLHPAVLEHVGLASALQLNCEEVSRATGMTLRLVNDGDTSTIPPDIALCLFRVAQEALSNVTRHSGAHNVDLSLRCTDAELWLKITDDGRGFTPGAPHQAAGLGLHSAAERVHALGGALTIDSAPGAGTTLHATVPLRDTHYVPSTRHSRR